MDSGSKELIIVLVVMGVLLAFAITAVVIFIRVWRKERK
jgi:type II secretory pathway pseudopilin PulG